MAAECRLEDSNEGETMSRVRRICILSTATLMAAFAAIGAGSPAFAARLLPPGGGDGSASLVTVAHPSGVTPWQAALVAIAAAALAAAITAFVMRARHRSRIKAAVPFPAS